MSVTRSVISYLRHKFQKNLQRNVPYVSLNNRIAISKMHTIHHNEALSVTVADMRRQLRLNGYPVEDGFTCIITKCPICKSESKSNENKSQAYINKTTGFFLCSNCDYSGRWDTFEKIITEKTSIDSIADDTFFKGSEKFATIWNDLIEKTTLLTTMEDVRVQQSLIEFDLPVFPDILKLLTNVRISLDGKSLYFPLQNLSNKIVGYIDIQSGRFPDVTEPSFGCGGISWFKSIRSHSKEHPLIIVPTIADALAVMAQKLPGGVACLPYGLNYLPQEVLPVLEKCPKLILWAGPDGTGHMRAIARKLGETRCLLIRATDSQPSAREALRNDFDIKSIVSSARPIWHKSITTFKSLREDVYSDLCNVEKVQGIKWQRYPILNKLIHGHRRGELTVLTGPTGCGKTTFCSEYSLDLAVQGVNTLWGSFEIRNVRLVRTMLQQLAGFPLEENLDQFDKVADIFQNLPLYFLMFHGQQTIKDVMEAVEHASYVHDIAHVIIDNVQFMLGVGDDVSKHTDRFWKQDAVIGAFRTFATRRDCHVTLVMHPRKERDVDDLSTNSIFGSAKASQEADNVLIIQDKRLTAIKGKKYLQIAKNRYSGDLGIMPLEFDKSSLSYGTKKTKTPGKDNVKKEESQ